MFRQLLKGVALALGALCLVTLWMVTVGDTSQAQALRPTNGRIAFQSNRDDGDWDIYVMDSDGTGVQRLTFLPSDETQPVWSPDGRQIAFNSNRIDDLTAIGIFVMDADGANEAYLTPGLPARDPAWSPDGTQIAFTSHRDHLYGDIFVMDADGSNVTNVTDFAGQDRGAWNPSWTPDGRIIFAMTEDVLNNDPGFNYYVMNADRTDWEPLARGGFTISRMAMSPDGETLLYSMEALGVFVFRQNTDGSDLVPGYFPPTLPPSGTVHGSNPAWSPDGDYVVFTLLTLTGSKIAVMEQDGSNITELTGQGDRANDYPDWQPIFVPGPPDEAVHP